MRATPSASSNLASSASGASSKSLEALFTYASDISYFLFGVARGLGVSTFARSKRANVFATQKQCFCLEWLSALKELKTRYAISSSVKAQNRSGLLLKNRGRIARISISVRAHNMRNSNVCKNLNKLLICVARKCAMIYATVFVCRENSLI